MSNFGNVVLVLVEKLLFGNLKRDRKRGQCQCWTPGKSDEELQSGIFLRGAVTRTDDGYIHTPYVVVGPRYKLVCKLSQPH